MQDDCCNHDCYQGRDCPRRLLTNTHRVTRQEPPSEAATERSDAIGRAAVIAVAVAAALAVIFSQLPFGGTP
jgi:hypothetical protein